MVASFDSLASLQVLWQAQLQEWFNQGRLLSAAVEALGLDQRRDSLEAWLHLQADQGFTDLPPLQLLAGQELPAAKAAYAAATGKILINRSWLAQAPVSEVLLVLTEEWGHHLDTLFNNVDTPGDEGELFVALLANPDLSDSLATQIRADNDHGWAVLNGEQLAIEMAAFNGDSGDNNLVGSDAGDTFSPGLGKDTIDGGSGDDLLILDYSSINSKMLSELKGSYGDGVYGKFRAEDNSTSVDYYNISRFKVTGTSLADDIRLWSGADTVKSGNGDDVIDCGGGNDSIDGGDGNDTLLRLDLSASRDNLKIDNTGLQITTAGVSVVGIERFVQLSTGSGNDTLDFSAWNFDDSASTGDGNDTILPGFGRDTIDGGSGDDLLILDYSSINSKMLSELKGSYGDGVYGKFRAEDNSTSVDYYDISRFKVTGTSLADDIRLWSGADTVKSGNGDDVIDCGGGNDSIDGGDGNDTLLSLDLRASRDNLKIDNTGLQITTAGVSVVGIERFVRLSTGSGNDTLDFSAWNFDDSASTGDGNDTILPGFGRDTIDGGSGDDLLILDYSSINSKMLSELKGSYGDGVYGKFRAEDNSTSVDYYDISRFKVTGTSLADDIRLWSGADTVKSGNGDDVIDCGGGNDSIDGGDGNDTLLSLDLRASRDNLKIDNTGLQITTAGVSVVGIERFVRLSTGSGNDTLDFSAWNFDDSASTGDGNDTILPGFGRDTIDGGSGDDLLILDYSSINSKMLSELKGSYGDGVYGKFRAEDNSTSVDYYDISRFKVTGTSLADDIRLWSGADTVKSGNGDDVIDCGGGNDSIDGGDGNDTLLSLDLRASRDNLKIDNTGLQITTAGVSVVGIERFVRLSTGSGNDTLDFSAWNFDDSASTGDGNDTILPGFGRDTIDGGSGDDLLILDYSSINSKMLSELKGSYGDGVYGKFRAEDNSTSVDYYDISRFKVTGTSLADDIRLWSGADTVKSGNGDDVIDCGGGNDSIDGGDGNDTLLSLDLRASRDNLKIDNTGLQITTAGVSVVGIERFVRLSTGSGNDTLDFSAWNFDDSASTGDGNDTILPGFGRDTIDGGSGDDLLILDYSSINSKMLSELKGSYGDGVWGKFRAEDNSTSVDYYSISRFKVTGTSLADDIRLWTGADTITAGAGDDVINTGGGADSIVAFDAKSTTPGRGEHDQVILGAGAERLLLAVADRCAYDDGSSGDGEADYLQVDGFNKQEDALQLAGQRSWYRLDPHNGNTRLLLRAGVAPGIQGADELVAVISGVTGLDLGDGAFQFLEPSTTAPRHTILAPKTVVAAAQERFALPLRYSFSTGDTTARAFQLALHFDSSQISYDSFRAAAGLQAPTISTAVDSLDLDGDPKTDKMLLLSWSAPTTAANGSNAKPFPGVDAITGYPVMLGAPLFLTRSTFTGASTTSVRFSSSSLSSGEQLVADPVTLTATQAAWSLDLDGSGRYELASDSRLFMRHGLGTFPAAALTDGSLDPLATRVEPSAILRELQRGMGTSGKPADLDGSNTFLPLSDGLLAAAYGSGLITATTLPAGLTDPAATRADADSLWRHLQGITPTASSL